MINPKIKIKRFNKTSCIFHLISSTNVRCVWGKLLVFYFFFFFLLPFRLIPLFFLPAFLPISSVSFYESRNVFQFVIITEELSFYAIDFPLASTRLTTFYLLDLTCRCTNCLLNYQMIVSFVTVDLLVIDPF